MVKATRVRYSGTAPYMDDTQVNRVQASGSSSRLTTEDLKELGTLNIVEVVDDVPQVDVSLDTNENGTNQVIGLVANKGYGCQVVAVPSGNQVGTSQVEVRSGSFYAKGNRVSFSGGNLTVSGNGTQYVYLLNEVSGNQLGIGSSVPTGAIPLATVAPSGGVVNQANITDTRSFKQITESDFELAKVTVFAPIKQSGSGDTVQRTMYMENVYVNNMDLSFQVSGVATASYRLETDNKRWFLNGASQLVVDQFKTTTATALTLSQTPYKLANGNFMLSVVKNGTPLAEGVDFTVSGNTLTLTVAPVSGDLVKVRYATSTGGPWFAPVPAIQDPHPELAGGIKNGQIEIYLSDDMNNRLTRVQTASISVPLTRDALQELGTMYPYDRPLQLPITLSVNLDLKDTDLELMARFAGYTNLSDADEIAIIDLIKNMGLTVKIYRETDVKRAKLPQGHPDLYPIKTIFIPNLIPQSENWDVRVDSDATQTFSFNAHNITISDAIDLS